MATRMVAKHVSENKSELLFEIGCEEIPAGMLPKAESELKEYLGKLLSAESLADGVTVETFSGPRRLTACARGLLSKQAETNGATDCRNRRFPFRRLRPHVEWPARESAGVCESSDAPANPGSHE